MFGLLAAVGAYTVSLNANNVWLYFGEHVSFVVRQTSHITTHRNTSQQLSLGTQVPQDIDCGDGTEIKLRFNYFSDVIQVFFFLYFTLTLVVCRKINYII